MCGLFFSSDPSRLRHRSAITALLERRGTEPACWYQAADGSLFAHSLLPVRGTAPCHQPLVQAGRVLAFTGELWDVPRGAADTALVFERLRSCGARQMVATSRGTFAFIYLDGARGRFIFATDPMGEQPLHFGTAGGHFHIASEMKPLVVAGVPLAAIRHVQPGRVYSFRRHQLEPTVWTPPQAASDPRWVDFDARVLRRRIAEAVTEQVVSVDQQGIGVLLSGGIDSTIVAYEAACLGVRRAWTVATSPDAPDAVRARQAAHALGLDWTLVLAAPAPAELGVVCGEVANRSIVEELCMHATLAAELARAGLRVVLTGSGADELFIGYGHLLGRVHVSELQRRFLSTYYRYDLRACNKLFMGYGVEPRNPFLSRRVVSYAIRMSPRLLIGPGRVLKYPLRRAYAEMLPDPRAPKLIARETMGAKAIFEKKLGNSPYVYRETWGRLLGDPRATARWLKAAGRLEARAIHREVY